MESQFPWGNSAIKGGGASEGQGRRKPIRRGGKRIAGEEPGHSRGEAACGCFQRTTRLGTEKGGVPIERKGQTKNLYKKGGGG